MYKGEALEIIYEDAWMVAINKPPGLLVHRSSIAADANQFALQLLRNQLGRFVYPIHRLDRKTSGVLLFAFDSKTAKILSDSLMNHHIKKRYLAIVRGYFSPDQTLDYDLTNDKGKIQSAITQFKLLERTEIDLAFGKHPTSRYSLIEAFPKTGRMHQIRKHCAHLNYPIIGDRPHGCNKQNKLFKERWKMINMLLHARKILVPHPDAGELIHIEAEPSRPFKEMYDLLFVKLKI